jgi:hypothetical protein
MTITFSRRLAIAFGVLVPVAETFRRWDQLGDLSLLPNWLDDYILGAFLFYGVYRTGKDVRSGRPFLAAAWGFTCGMGYLSFFGQLSRLHEPDPSSIPSSWIVTIKGVGLALGIIALAGSLRKLPDGEK